MAQCRGKLVTVGWINDTNDCLHVREWIKDRRVNKEIHCAWRMYVANFILDRKCAHMQNAFMRTPATWACSSSHWNEWMDGWMNESKQQYPLRIHIWWCTARVHQFHFTQPYFLLWQSTTHTHTATYIECCTLAQHIILHIMLIRLWSPCNFRPEQQHSNIV